jgi:hypothetical protein
MQSDISFNQYSIELTLWVPGRVGVGGCDTRRPKIVLREQNKPITAAARSRASTVFASSSTGIVGSNLTRGMDVCESLFGVCVVLRIGSGLATGWSPVQGVLPTVYRLINGKNGQDPTKGCSAIDYIET